MVDDKYAICAEQHPTWSNYKIAAEFGVDESTVRRHLKSVKFQRAWLPEDREVPIEIDSPIRIDGPLVVTADWHMPLTDYAYVNTMIDEARAEDYKTLLIAGDYFNFDALSQYDPKQNSANLELELKEGVAVMRVLLETFGRIIYVWGNHDARMHKSLGHKLQFSSSMRLCFGALGDALLERIEFTNLDHVWVDTPAGEWYVCHPLSYNRNPLTTARAIAARTGTHVLTAHSHHCAIGYAVDGVHVVGECGGFFDVEKTAYLQRSTTHPRWVKGYAVINQEGLLMSRSPGWTT